MAKKKDARDMLDRVIKLIKRDIVAIEEGREINEDNAGVLVKYSDALLRLAKDQDDQEDAEKEQAGKLSKEELLKKMGIDPTTVKK